MLNFQDFKEECYKIRNNRKEYDYLMKALNGLDAKMLEAMTPVMDYTRDHIQTRKDPDGKIIEALDERDERRRGIEQRIHQLKDIDTKVYESIWNCNNVPGVTVLFYFIFGQSLQTIATNTNVSKSKCARDLHDGLEEVYNIYMSNSG